MKRRPFNLEKENGKWERPPKDANQAMQNTGANFQCKDDAIENSFYVKIIPGHISSKFNKEILIFFDCGYGLKVESSF